MAEYGITIVCLSGRQNVVVNTLSRTPLSYSNNKDMSESFPPSFTELKNVPPLTLVLANTANQP